MAEEDSPLDKVLAVRRTLAPPAIAGLVLLAGEWGIDMSWLTDRPVTLIIAYFLLSAAIYLIAIVAGPRAPWLEKVLLTSTRHPTYQEPQP